MDICRAGARAAANQLHLTAAINRRDGQTGGQTDTVPLYRRLSLKAASVDK